jgi:hypothetical protein
MKTITRCLLSLFILLLITGWQITRAQTPVISSITPVTGTVGTLVTISGTNLSNPLTLTIGGANAIPVKNDGTSLVAMVMPGAISGNAVITTAGGTATSTDPFVLQKSGSTFTQQNTKLVGSDRTGNGRLGNGVAISADGNTAVVGAPYDNSSTGAVWIFTRSGGTWSQQGTKLVGTGATGAALQGYSVAISADGNTILSGGEADNSNMGAVWVFTRSGSVWTQQGSKLVGSGATAGFSAYEGCSVTLSADGNTAAFGGYGLGSNTGSTWVFTRSGGVWTQQGSRLVGSGAVVGIAGQGYSVALSADGNTLLTGGYMDGWAVGTATGAAWIFTRTGTTWSQQGSKLVGTGSAAGNVAQGASVALSADGNTALIGGYADNNSKGAAWVFTRTGATWTQQGVKLVGAVASVQSYQGNSVALSADGNTAIVGGYMDVNTTGGGGWVYKRTGATWAQMGSRLNGTGNAGDPQQGYSIALSADGSTIAMGGELDNNQVGALWVFQTDPVALPLYWLSVDAKAVSKTAIKINWSTTTEINTAYFEIQRSTDNSNGNYTTIGTLPAQNNSGTVNSYALTDQYTFTDGTRYQYRIKQVDIDGRYTYSPIKTVKFNLGQDVRIWQVYPNPVKRNEGINLTAIGGGIQPDEIIQVELTNMTGQVLYQVKEVLSGAGKRLNERLASLTPGMYTLVIKYRAEQQALPLIVQ